MKNIFFFLLTCSFIVSNTLTAQVSLPSVFSDNMVLQRDSDIKIWGWGKRGSKLIIIPSWSKDSIQVQVTGDGTWKANVKTLSAGGPHSINFINAGKSSQIANILFGEVWLCSGQSNMEWGAQNKLQEMLDEIKKPKNENIRLLHVNRAGSANPQDNFFGKWELATNERLKEFSAIGYFIAQKLNKELNVPIGIISANIGGTNAEVWTPEYSIVREKELLADALTFKPHKSRPTRYAASWNAMLNPLKGYTLAGFYWYQGESNVDNYKNYGRLMSTLVKAWREEWKDSKLPFYFVQIAPYKYSQSTKEEQKGALLREQQESLLTLPNTGMVVVSDLVPDVTDIHPSYKREVANRLANIALAEKYNQHMKDYKSPVYRSHTVRDNEIIIEFYNVLDGLIIKDGKSIKELVVAGEDNLYKIVDARVDDNKLIVSTKNIRNPKSLLFSFSDTGISNLFTKTGLPVAPFRISINNK